MFIPCSDSKVESSLCKGVPVKFTLKVGIGLSDYWILENSEPNILKVFVKEVAIILVLPLLSCSSPRWENLPSGHQRYPLLGINLGYMYWGQKHSSE